MMRDMAYLVCKIHIFSVGFFGPYILKILKVINV